MNYIFNIFIIEKKNDSEDDISNMYMQFIHIRFYTKIMNINISNELPHLSMMKIKIFITCKIYKNKIRLISGKNQHIQNYCHNE